MQRSFKLDDFEGDSDLTDSDEQTPRTATTTPRPPLPKTPRSPGTGTLPSPRGIPPSRSIVRGAL